MPTWAIPVIVGIISFLLGLAVKWGVQINTIAHLESEVTLLKTSVGQLTARIESLALMLAEQRGLERGREQTDKYPAIQVD